MRHVIPSVLLLTLFLAPLNGYCAEINAGPQSPINPALPAARNYPKIVLYSVSWCPHCREAKEYFTHNNIPFINRDVEQDEAAMRELTGKYRSQGVPVIVIGDDARILKGFDRDVFEKALREVQGKR